MSMNMNMLKEERNRGYLIAGIGAIVALISFLFLPYVTAVIISFSGAQAAGFNGLLWLEAVTALIAIAVAALLIFRSTNPFGMSTTPLATQIRWGVYGLIGAGALGLLIHIIALIGSANSLSQASSFGVGYGFGFWLYLLAMIAVVVGGVLALRTASASPSTQAFPPPQQWPPQQQWPPVQPPQQQWQQPQYPPSQYTPPTQYAPPPQYGPPTQYPPMQYPPQPPQQQWPPAQQQQPPTQQPPWQ